MNAIKFRLTAACVFRAIALVTLLLAASGSFAAIPKNTKNPKSIRVVMDDNYPPYVFKDDNGQLKGITIDQWGLWEKKTGIHVEVSGMDWGEAQRRMQAGEFDVIDTIFRNEKRESIYDFTKPYARLDVPLFFHEDISGIRGPADLKGFLVAVKAGDNSIDILKKHGVTNITEYPSYEKLIEAARDGKVKVFTVDRPPALYFLNRMGIQSRFRETAPLYSGEFHRAVLKGRSDLLATVEKGFADITPAEYHAIEKNWMGTPISASPYFRYVGYTAAVIAVFVAGLLTWLGLLKRAVAIKTRKLQENEERLSLALNASNSGIWDWNVKTGKVYFDANYFKLAGYEPDEFPHAYEEWERRVHPDDVDQAKEAIEAYLTGKSGIYSGEFRFKTKDGSWMWILGQGKLFEYDEQGNPVRFTGTHTDITDRKRVEQERLHLEQQLLHTQKLESLGVLAGGIAHDFNNILTSIVGNADLALMRLSKESPALENLHRIEKAAAQAADLARQMLAYSGKGKFVVESLDLGRLLEEMLHLLEVSISKKALLCLNPAPDLPAVEGDAAQLRQIIMNLVINASEAIGGKDGVITITTGCMDCDKNYLQGVRLDENIKEGPYVYLEITDTGCGMDKNTLGKIFDPFFTTKFTGRGLGMAAVLGIIRGHKGAITVHSEPGKGTTFKILLPSSGKPVEISDGKSSKEEWKGAGKVLLVDDEEAVRGIGKEMLLELGFETITANNGLEAMQIFKQTPDIAFVILDLTMPHMDGEQCFRELKQLKPDVKVIMSSGFSEHEVTQKFDGKGLAGFIQKPYTFSVLRNAILPLFSENIL